MENPKLWNPADCKEKRYLNLLRKAAIQVGKKMIERDGKLEGEALYAWDAARLLHGASLEAVILAKKNPKDAQTILEMFSQFLNDFQGMMRAREEQEKRFHKLLFVGTGDIVCLN